MMAETPARSQSGKKAPPPAIPKRSSETKVRGPPPPAPARSQGTQLTSARTPSQGRNSSSSRQSSTPKLRAARPPPTPIRSPTTKPKTQEPLSQPTQLQNKQTVKLQEQRKQEENRRQQQQKQDEQQQSASSLGDRTMSISSIPPPPEEEKSLGERAMSMSLPPPPPQEEIDSIYGSVIDNKSNSTGVEAADRDSMVSLSKIPRPESELLYDNVKAEELRQEQETREGSKTPTNTEPHEEPIVVQPAGSVYHESTKRDTDESDDTRTTEVTVKRPGSVYHRKLNVSVKRPTSVYHEKTASSKEEKVQVARPQSMYHTKVGDNFLDLDDAEKSEPEVVIKPTDDGYDKVVPDRRRVKQTMVELDTSAMYHEKITIPPPTEEDVAAPLPALPETDANTKDTTQPENDLFVMDDSIYHVQTKTIKADETPPTLEDERVPPRPPKADPPPAPQDELPPRPPKIGNATEEASPPALTPAPPQPQEMPPPTPKNNDVPIAMGSTPSRDGDDDHRYEMYMAPGLDQQKEEQNKQVLKNENEDDEMYEIMDISPPPSKTTVQPADDIYETVPENDDMYEVVDLIKPPSRPQPRGKLPTLPSRPRKESIDLDTYATIPYDEKTIDPDDDGIPAVMTDDSLYEFTPVPNKPKEQPPMAPSSSTNEPVQARSPKLPQHRPPSGPPPGVNRKSASLRDAIGTERKNASMRDTATSASGPPTSPSSPKVPRETPPPPPVAPGKKPGSSSISSISTPKLPEPVNDSNSPQKPDKPAGFSVPLPPSSAPLKKGALVNEAMDQSTRSVLLGEGYLEKLKGNAFKTRNRHFRLTADRFAYYEFNGGPCIKGYARESIISIEDQSTTKFSVKIMLDSDKSKDASNKQQNSSRDVILQAPNNRVKAKWLRLLRLDLNDRPGGLETLVIEGYLTIVLSTFAKNIMYWVKLTNRSLIFHKDEESEIVWSALVSDIQMLEDCKDKRDIRVKAEEPLTRSGNKEIVLRAKSEFEKTKWAALFQRVLPESKMAPDLQLCCFMETTDADLED
eukprot:m.29455 g.29455  ORF g.29455 m.29455 type:complete len:1027 (-) comp8104_c0_seq2:155-3235(-)